MVKQISGLWVLVLVGLLTGCATFSGPQQPPVVTVAGLTPLPGRGLAPQFTVTLNIQNRNDQALSISGLDFDLEVDGRRFASGVSAMDITLQPLAETTTEVAVTVNGLAVAMQLFDWLQTPPDGLQYEISGHLHLQQGLRRRLAFSRGGELPLTAGSRR